MCVAPRHLALLQKRRCLRPGPVERDVQDGKPLRRVAPPRLPASGVAASPPPPCAEARRRRGARRSARGRPPPTLFDPAGAPPWRSRFASPPRPCGASASSPRKTTTRQAVKRWRHSERRFALSPARSPFSQHRSAYRPPELSPQKLSLRTCRLGPTGPVGRAFLRVQTAAALRAERLALPLQGTHLSALSGQINGRTRRSAVEWGRSGTDRSCSAPDWRNDRF